MAEPLIPDPGSLPVFLYGRLMDPALREIVLDEDICGQPAHLPGRALRQSAHGPVLCPSEEGTDGMIVTPSGEAQRRLLLYAQAQRLQMQRAEVETSQGTTPVRIFASQDEAMPEPWQFDQWQREAAPLARAAAAEFMETAHALPETTLPARYSQAEGRAWSRHLAQRPRPRSLPLPPTAPVAVTHLAASHLGFFRLDDVTLRVPRFTGGLGPAIDREVFVGYDGALVLPYDPRCDAVLVVEQFRLGVWRRGDPDPWTLEPVAGMVDPAERPEDAARREAHEEAGLTLNWLEPIAGIYASPGYNVDYFHCFAAGASLEGADGRIGGALSEAEDIRAHVLPLNRALQMVETGEINVGPLVMMLLWLERNKTRLREKA